MMIIIIITIVIIIAYDFFPITMNIIKNKSHKKLTKTVYGSRLNLQVETSATYHANHPSQCKPGCRIVGTIMERWNVVIFIPRSVTLDELRMSCGI